MIDGKECGQLKVILLEAKNRPIFLVKGGAEKVTFDISSMKRQLTDSLDSFCRMRNDEDEQDDMI